MVSSPFEGEQWEYQKARSAKPCEHQAWAALSGGFMSRDSIHVEPRGFDATARHYIRDLVYGANDGIITTFAVVGGVTGGALSQTAVLIVGIANLAADGVSMGVGNLLAIRANERAREAQNLPEEEAYPWKHGLATLLAFIGAGAVPLVPFVLPLANRAAWSSVLTFVTLFLLGVARATITTERWWKTGLETLALGALVALAAYGAGVVVAWALT
jgi:VIT1/CCC1 family predicted Fe2+/Mn2+ transporter